LEENKAVFEADLCRYESMLQTLQMMQQKYGGVAGYIKAYCGLGDEDINAIQRNLVSEEEPIFG
jgi:hypothetical protein